MFGSLKRIAQGVAAVAQAVTELSREIHGLREDSKAGGGLADRVDALEQSLAVRLAEANGVLLEATNERKAARAAEERARRKYRADRELGFLDEDGEGDGDEPSREGEEVLVGNASSSDGAPVPTVHPRVEGGSRDDAKQAAMRYRFGRP